MARIISFSIPEDWEFTTEVMDLSSSGIRAAIEEGLKAIKDKESIKDNEREKNGHKVIGGIKE